MVLKLVQRAADASVSMAQASGPRMKPSGLPHGALSVVFKALGWGCLVFFLFFSLWLLLWPRSWSLWWWREMLVISVPCYLGIWLAVAAALAHRTSAALALAADTLDGKKSNAPP